MIFFGTAPSLGSGAEVLQIGFNQRLAVFQIIHERVFALDDLVHNLINADRCPGRARPGIGEETGFTDGCEPCWSGTGAGCALLAAAPSENNTS